MRAPLLWIGGCVSEDESPWCVDFTLTVKDLLLPSERHVYGASVD